MPLKILQTLRKSEIIKEIISVSFDGIGNYYRLKIRVRLRNNWLMDIWEHKTPKLRRYSYHIFSGKKLIVRWDNAPHFKNLSTFPHHKHTKTKVEESKEMTIKSVLKELEKNNPKHGKLLKTPCLKHVT